VIHFERDDETGDGPFETKCYNSRARIYQWALDAGNDLGVIEAFLWRLRETKAGTKLNNWILRRRIFAEDALEKYGDMYMRLNKRGDVYWFWRQKPGKCSTGLFMHAPRLMCKAYDRGELRREDFDGEYAKPRWHVPEELVREATKDLRGIGVMRLSPLESEKEAA